MNERFGSSNDFIKLFMIDDTVSSLVSGAIKNFKWLSYSVNYTPFSD